LARGEPVGCGLNPSTGLTSPHSPSGRYPSADALATAAASFRGEGGGQPCLARGGLMASCSLPCLDNEGSARSVSKSAGSLHRTSGTLAKPLAGGRSSDKAFLFHVPSPILTLFPRMSVLSLLSDALVSPPVPVSDPDLVSSPVPPCPPPWEQKKPLGLSLFPLLSSSASTLILVSWLYSLRGLLATLTVAFLRKRQGLEVDFLRLPSCQSSSSVNFLMFQGKGPLAGSLGGD